MPRVLLALALCVAFSSGAKAQTGLRVHEVERIRVDGSLRDWGGAERVSLGEGPDASMRYAIGHDARGFYFAAEVSDDRLVRTPTPGAREDAIIFTFARGQRAFDVFLFAGVTGRSPASAGIAQVGTQRVSAISSAQVVEAPAARGHGYVLEAFVPFAAIPGSEQWQEGRGSVRLRDVDSEAHPEIEAEPALVPVEPRRLGALVPLIGTGGTEGGLTEFLNQRGLASARPSHDLRGDVAGDDQPERVVVVDRFLFVSGPGFRGGRGFAYHELPVSGARDVRDADLEDLTGDGKAELVIVLRQRNDQGERDLWQVMSLSGESPRSMFAIEIRKATQAGFVEARVSLSRGRGARTIELRSGSARGLDRASYQESPASDVEPILLPWGPIMERTYRWDGRAFARAGERPNPRYEPPREEREEQAAPQPSAPSAPSEEQLLTAFREQNGIAANARPRFRLRTNLAGTNEPETALVFGRKLVVVGPGVQGGRSWFFYEIPAPSDADLLGVEAADVTSDGRAELLFRVRQTFGDVRREVLIVHMLGDRGFPRLLQVEVARQQGDSSVQNEVRTRGGALEIDPGRARGWSAERWPFSPDANDSVEPLLLPWRDRAVRYTRRGERLVR
jgi:hypothetical protein